MLSYKQGWLPKEAWDWFSTYRSELTRLASKQKLLYQ